MKARCMMMIPKYELVQMTTVGLNYVVQNKMASQQLRDVPQMTDRARLIEKLNLEKEKLKK